MTSARATTTTVRVLTIWLASFLASVSASTSFSYRYQQRYCSSWGTFHTMCQFQAQACPGKRLIRSGGLTQYDKRVILYVHNQLRSEVASGNIRSLPPAENMQLMTWDDELAAIAQRWADQCRDGHDTKRDVSRFSVGQNVALVWSYRREDEYGDRPNWEPQIRRWFNEYHGFSSHYISPFRFSPRLSHFTQIAWADTNKVGCGYSYFYHHSRGYTKMYVCNYGPGGNVVRGTMYEASRRPACTKPRMAYSSSFPGLCVNGEESYGEPRPTYIAKQQQIVASAQSSFSSSQQEYLSTHQQHHHHRYHRQQQQQQQQQQRQQEYIVPSRARPQWHSFSRSHSSNYYNSYYKVNK